MQDKESTFEELIQLCEEHGYDWVIRAMELVVLKNEIEQANLFAGADEVKVAVKMSAIIAKQNFTIGKLKRYKKKNERKNIFG